jgi:hypothetical protein
VEIELHFKPRPIDGAPRAVPVQAKVGGKRSRPSKRKRLEIRSTVRERGIKGAGEAEDEEQTMNGGGTGGGNEPIEIDGEEEEAEEIEER